MTQLDLFSAASPARMLTLADIDEWIDLTRAAASAHGASHTPHEWARVALSALLGEEIPDRSWSTGELLDLLARARAALTEEDTQ